MYRKLILIVTFIVLIMMIILVHRHEVRSATSRVGWPPAPTVKFVASTEKPFGRLMSEAMNIMHRDMGNVGSSGDADRDFVTMMIPHHQGAIDMAKSLLLYGKDPQMRRLAQEMITDQQSEIQLMQLWLKQHATSTQTQMPKPGLEARKN